MSSRRAPSGGEVEAFLDWAWNDWGAFRSWQSAERRRVGPESDSARDDRRLLFPSKPDCAFLIGVRAEAGTVRVGLVTRNRWLSEGIEQAVLDNGGSMTEFLEDEMEADSDLPFPMLHYHDSGEFYFVSEIPFSDLADPALRARVKLYFEGYVRALEERLEEE